VCRKEVRVHPGAEPARLLGNRKAVHVGEAHSFRFIERRLANAGRGLGDADLAEMDILWDQAKAESY
jgi:hypothetical protein